MRRATLEAIGSGGASPSAKDRELRVLEVAIVASIALHVLAFAALQRVTPKQEPAVALPAPISARLIDVRPPLPPAPPAPVVSPAASMAAAPAPESTARSQPTPPQARLAPIPEPKIESKTPAKVEPRPSPQAASKPAPTPRLKPPPKPPSKARSETRSGAEAERAPSPPRETPESVPPPSTVARSAPLPAPASSAPAVDEDEVARYRVQLIAAARRYKRYPRAAMDNQWEGAAEVAMVIGANGRIREMMIDTSSGHEVLDRQAIDMFRKAKPLVPIPEALRGREFRVSLKAIYSLRDPGA